MTEYSAQFKQALPSAVHWYVRIEDGAGQWRVENKWLPKKGPSLSLSADMSLLDDEASAASAASAAAVSASAPAE